MANNYGKKFEETFKEDWIRSFPDGTIDRIYDQMSGYRSISGISDFIGYNYPYHFYLEVKSHKNASFPLDNLTQYDDLLPKVGIRGVRVGMILWLIDKDSVTYWPISTIKKLKEAGIKSVNPEKLEKEGYRFVKIPSVKKRVFMYSDYSVLMNLEEGE